MSMKWNNLAGPDQRLENSNRIVFEEQCMILRGGYQSVQVPYPFVSIAHGPDYNDAS